MDSNTSSKCSIEEDELFISDCSEASKSLNTMTSLNDAKHERATAYAGRTFVSVQPFKTRDEFLSAMIEDVTEWLNSLFSLEIRSSELMSHLDTGVLLCRLANLLETLMVGDEKRDDSADRETSNSPDDQEPTFNVRRSVASRPLATFGGIGPVVYRENASRGSFQSRDNISNFLNWCRNRLKLSDTVLFETEDLVAGRNERNVVLCLLEVARRGSKHGMPVPELIELESEIDAELGQEESVEDEDEAERLMAQEEQVNGTELEQATSTSDLCDVERSIEVVKDEVMAALLQAGRQELQLTSGGAVCSDGAVCSSPVCSGSVCSGGFCHGASPSIGHPAGLCQRLRDLLRMRARRTETIRMKDSIQMDMLNLDELVHRFLGNCRCQHRYPMIKVSEGRYRIGENFMLIFVRLLRNHVMLRIGGGWETLADYLSRHDPCRAAEQHRKTNRHSHDAAEETILSNDDDENELVNDKRATTSEEEKMPEEGKNTPEKQDARESDEERNAPEKDEISAENDQTVQGNDKTQETMNDAKQQELGLYEAEENFST